MSKPIKDKQKDNGNKWSSSSSSSRFFKRNGLEALGGYPSSSILGPGTQRKDVFDHLSLSLQKSLVDDLLQDHINTLATDKEYKEQYYPSQRTEQQEQPLPLTSTIAIKNDSDAEKESKYSVSSSASLMTSMVKRLRHVEGIVQEKQVRLAEKDEEIERLQREIHLLKRPGATGRNSQADLTTENRRLQKKIKEMEKFLEDYGLIWVGEQDPHNVEDTQTDENDEVEEEILPSYEESTSSSPVTMSDEDFDLLIRKIQELNALINQNEGTCTFVADRSKGNGKFHRLVPSKVDHIPCTIYLNGLFLKRGPLRSFEEPSTQDFIKDILDGFFPTDFKDEFPQGVIFDIQDKRKETYEDKAQINKPKRKINSLAALGEPNMSLTRKELLSSLPISVLRDGKIIKIREEIEELLEPSSTKVNIIHVDTPDAGKDGANLTTIHVRSSDGEHTLVLKMKYNDTIGQLKSFITNFRTKQDKFQLICPFPTKKILTVDTQSLEEAQLIPNATLYIRSI